MTGTVAVLVVVLIVRLLVGVLAMAATFILAKRNGQSVKAMSWSPTRGFAAKFFPPREGGTQSGTTN
jgi:hypothetical protein